MNRPTVSYAVLSDVHLGHRRNPSTAIIENLKKVLGQLTSQRLDVLFIAGDLFDRLLDNSMPDKRDINLWIYWLLKYCHLHHVKLRVLEGTPSHDWKQSTNIDIIRQISGLELDYAYVPALHIEHLSDLGLYVLYVPDEWNETTTETFQQVQSLMAEAGISQVDIAIMHGQFNYQIRQAPASIPRHQEDDYLGIVRHYIHIGHVHTHTVNERIIAQGSFDRLSHGEEEPKGLVWAEVRSDGTRQYHFIENTEAMIFKTVQLKGEDIQDIMAYLDKRILKYRPGSFIRLKGRKDHPGFSYYEELKKRYALYSLTKQGEELETTQVVDIGVLNDYQSFSITTDNVRGLLSDNIRARYEFHDQHWTYMHGVLDEILGVKDGSS